MRKGSRVQKGRGRFRPWLLVAGLTWAGFALAQAAGSAPQPLGLPSPEVRARLNQRVADLPKGTTGTSLDALARTLAEGLPDEVEKLYVLYRWVTQNIEYDTDAYYSGDLSHSASAKDTFLQGKAVCDGYADLMSLMGRAVGLQIESIGGYGKGLSYKVGAPVLSRNHAWNAVKLQGKWHFLDSTWDAGTVDAGARRFVRNVGELHYFLADPDIFITAHFPDEERWQLQSRRIGFQEFAKLVKVPPDISDWGLNPSAHRWMTVADAKAPAAFDFGPAAKKVTGKLSVQDKELPGNWVLQVRLPEGGKKMLVTAPQPGNYELSFYSVKQVTDVDLFPVLAYRIEFLETGAFARGFPLAYPEYFSRDIVLVEPLAGALPAGQPVPFRLKAEGALQMAVFQNGQVVGELAADAGFFAGQLPLTAGDAEVYARYEGQEWYTVGLLKYQVE